MRFTTQLLPSRSGNVGIVLLNNPDKLHALTIDMIYAMQDILKQWYTDPTFRSILFKSSDIPNKKVKAFCSGGDVKGVYLDGLKRDDQTHGVGMPGVATAEFFRQEYYVNNLLALASSNASLPPHVCFWDGIVMGGGVGISIHCKYRVATEHTIWAMPETAIGLFPDVGCMYWLSRLLLSQQKHNKGLAQYLALTGQRLKAPDLLSTGIATHYIPSSKLAEVESALVEASYTSSSSSSADSVAPVLMSFHQDPPDPPTLQHNCISQAFGDNAATSMESIQLQLQNMLNNNEDPSKKNPIADFARTTLDTLNKMSPTSLKVTLEAMRRGSSPHCTSMAHDLQMEYRIGQHMMQSLQSDFYEGIRATLIDKDHTPRWNPATVSEVTAEMVESYFAPIDYEWEMAPELLQCLPTPSTDLLDSKL